jgi:hypothetical protein
MPRLALGFLSRSEGYGPTCIFHLCPFLLVDAQLLESQGSSMASLSMDLEPTMKSSYSDVHPVLFDFLKMSMKDSPDDLQLRSVGVLHFVIFVIFRQLHPSLVSMSSARSLFLELSGRVVLSRIEV